MGYFRFGKVEGDWWREMPSDRNQRPSLTNSPSHALGEGRRRQQQQQQRRRVLNEDEYLNRLAHILRRDFFPELAKLEAQYEYLTAMEMADLTALREAATRLNLLEDGLKSGDQPAESSDTPLTLDEFQARYVTEDTAEYEELVERLNSIKRSKFIKVFKQPPPLLHGGPTSATTTTKRGKVNVQNTRIQKHVSLTLLERDPSDIRHHFWKMRKEYIQSTTDDDHLSTISSASTSGGISQMGGVNPAAYDLIDTPVMNQSAAPSTPLPTRAEERRKLLRTPAVQRLLKARSTPKLGGAFQVPQTPKRHR